MKTVKEVVKNVFARDMGIQVPVAKRKLPIPSKKTEKETDSSDYKILGNSSVSSAGYGRFLSPVKQLMHAYSAILLETHDNAVNFEIWLKLHCLLMLMMFFILPRGSIDSAIYTYKYSAV